jgi:hypothetical protein
MTDPDWHVDAWALDVWRLESELLPYRLKKAYPTLRPQAIELLTLFVTFREPRHYADMLLHIRRARGGDSRAVFGVQLFAIRKLIGKGSIVADRKGYHTLTPQGRSVVLDAIEAVASAPLSIEWRLHEPRE